MSSFKSSDNIQKKEGGPDRSVSDCSYVAEQAGLNLLKLVTISEGTF